MSSLPELLRRCTVKITGRQGTGFFVAPGKILTCAHVIGDREQTHVTIAWNTNLISAVVRDFIIGEEEHRSHFVWPDLALLEVDFQDHPCVLLLPDFSVNDEVYSFGYTDQYEEGDSTTAIIEGVSGFPKMIKFKLGQIRPGLSGSPLLNLRTGGICGIVKLSRNRSSDLGGRAVTTQTIIEQLPELVTIQAKYHHWNGVWIREMDAKQQTKTQQIPSSSKRIIAKLGFTSEDETDINLGLYWQLQNVALNMKPYGEWELASPVAAYIRTIINDPVYSKIFYAGMDHGGGIFKSLDGGLSWQLASTGLGCKSINYLKISPHDGLIYACTDNGIWASDNQGATWEWYSDDFKGEDVLCMLLSSDDPDFIAFGTRSRGGARVSAVIMLLVDEAIKPTFSLTGGRLHISRGKGMSWETFPIQTVNHFLFSPHDERIAYIASIDGGLFVTTDRFASLKPVEAMMKNKPGKIAIPIDNDNIIAIGSSKGLYLSHDKGESWQHCTEVGGEQVADVVFVNGNSNHILAASIKGMFESLDGGKSWTQINEGLRYRWSMAIVQTNEGKTFVGTSGGGVYERSKKGLNWVSRNLGLPTASCSTLVAGQDCLFVGSNGIYKSEDLGSSWEYLGLENQYVWSIATTTSNPETAKNVAVMGMRLSRDGGKSWRELATPKDNIVYAGTSNRIFVSKDHGTTWSVLASFDVSTYHGQVRDILLSSKTSGLMYANVAGSGIFRSINWGNDWKKLDTSVFGDEQVNSLRFLANSIDVLFACGSKGSVWFSLDDGDLWASSSTKFEHPITSITQSKNGEKIYIALSIGSIFVSTDRGVSFNLIGHVSNSENGFQWTTLFVHPQFEAILVLGTDEGAFFSRDHGKTWEVIQAGLLGLKYHINSFLLHDEILYSAMREGLFKLNPLLLKMA